MEHESVSPEQQLSPGLSQIIPTQAGGAVPTLPEAPSRRAFHAASPEAIAAYWSTSLDFGLTPEEASRRLSTFGPNVLEEPPAPGLLRRLVAQVSDFTVLALLAAAAIAATLAVVAPEPGQHSFLGRFGDSLAILLIVVLNAVLGLAQERRAERALHALKKLTAPTARVIRGGRTVDVSASDVVPGDIILLEEGDKVSADIRLLDTCDLEIEEAALTGESTPTPKDATALLEPSTPLSERVNMAFTATRVVRGRARGIVVSTGMHTELGAIAGMLASVETEETPLQRQLTRFGKDIVIGCVAVSAIVFLAGWLIGNQSARQMFLIAVSLAVAAIPEGLPAITTIVLALGTQRMAKRNALVRRLPAVETLGCAQIICTDKTGTLTQNAMTVRRAFAGRGTWEISGGGREVQGVVAPVSNEGDRRDLELLFHAASHAQGARLSAGEKAGEVESSGDPTDAALLVFAWKGKGERHVPRLIHEIAFSSARRLAPVVVEEQGAKVAFLRGAPEVILARSTHIVEGGTERPLTESDRQNLERIAASWGEEAMRVLALAMKRLPEGDSEQATWEEGLTFVGLVGMVDPPRPEVADAVFEATQAGIRTVIITGDHPATARAIARNIGLLQEGDLVVTGSDLDAIDQQRLESLVLRIRVVARATALHKLRIVEALKARGMTCAMTGDGVNDAPAVKAAHIGIAMGRSGTEVTKEAADLVLADDNYATIVAAIREGRTIYANIRRFIYFLLSSNAGIVLVVLFASLAGWNAPLTPIQILWINLITNGLPALALGVEPPSPHEMRAPPRPPSARLMPASSWLSLAGVGVVMAALTLASFVWAQGPHTNDPALLSRARTLAFAVLTMAPMFHAFNCRSATSSVFSLGLFTNKPLWGAVAVGVLLQALAVYVEPLHPVFKTAALQGHDALLVLALAACMLVLGELAKGLRALLGSAPSHNVP